MTKVFLSVCLVVFCWSCNANDPYTSLYVSAQGSPGNEGTEDNPFSSLSDAIERASTLKETNPSMLVKINVLEGKYIMTAPVEISSALSGLEIIGAGVDKVLFTGAIPLDVEWENFDDNIYVAKVDRSLDFDQLSVNNEVQILARYPNFDIDGHYWNGSARDAISIERIASWQNPVGAYYNVLHHGRWGGFHFEIAGVNDDGSPILKGGQQNNRPSRLHNEYRMVENVLEELDSPGEWFFDKREGKLYYWPPAQLDMMSASFEATVLKDFINVVGSKDDPVTDVAISGIRFENTKRTFMDEFEPLLRSDWMIYRGGAIFFEGTENCKITDCEFVDLGGNVIMASKYNQDLIIQRNHIHNCGASGICFVGDPSAVRSPSFTYKEFVPLSQMDTIAGPLNDQYPVNCLVENNLIYRIGRVEKQTAGVQIAMAMDITVRHNSIYDVPRAGINIGDGTWGGHVLEYNDVFNTVLETSDHGSFNSWGRDRFWHPKRKVMDSITSANPDMHNWDAIHTTVIRNNRFSCEHGWDIDLDDGSSNYHIYNNLLLNNGLKLREGFNRVAENNIIINNSLHPHVWFENSGDVFKYNIVGDTYQDVMLSGWGKELDYNLFPSENTMLKPQIYNRDLNSDYGDPLFVNPENMDFRVAPESPALRLGFKNFPMDRFGVQLKALRDIARTPKVPMLNKVNDLKNEASESIAWLRNKLKTVDSQEEQSAYGLKSTEGVIVLSTWRRSPAVRNNGIKKGDVILEVEGQVVSNLREFLKANSNNHNGKLNLIVMRDQSEIEITVNTK